MAIELVHVCDDQPGISRRRCGRGFAYFHSDGRLVRDKEVLQRIKALAIPPAYHSVWICETECGHLQATGIDDRGRKQYRYHEAFQAHQEEQKYGRMQQFGTALTAIREQVGRDLRLRGFSKRKVIAAIIRLLDKSLIRVGNEEYVRSNSSYGLTTLRNRHARTEGAELTLSFLGKSHVRHRVKVRDAQLSRFVRQLQDLPGQELFQYIGENGCPTAVTSTDVNSYIAEAASERFTAKDFRTWWGTVFVLIEFERQEPPTSKQDGAGKVSSAMKTVAGLLGNTPAICRKCYVHPSIVDAFLADTLPRPPDFHEDDAESLLIKVLRQKAKR